MARPTLRGVRKCNARPRIESSDMNLESLLRQPAWMKQALCTSSDPNLWCYERIHKNDKARREEFEEQVLRLMVAIDYCNQCPVRKQCLQMGLQKENMVGGVVYGGLLYSERVALTGHRYHISARDEAPIRNAVRKKVAKIV
jgi:hypothetical protein